MIQKIIITFLLLSCSYGQLIWHEGNLKKVEEVSLDIVVNGQDDPIWQEKLTQIALIFLEGYKLKIDPEIFSPTMVIQISLIKSKELSLYSYHVELSVFDLFLTKERYLENISKKKVLKKFERVYKREYELDSSKETREGKRKSPKESASIYRAFILRRISHAL